VEAEAAAEGPPEPLEWRSGGGHGRVSLRTAKVTRKGAACLCELGRKQRACRGAGRPAGVQVRSARAKTAFHSCQASA
jgi:hypothetical protein